MKFAEQLQSILERQGFTAAVVARCSGEEILRVGALDDIEQTGLFRILFGGSGEVSSACQYLEGKILPQVSGQGDLRCAFSLAAAGRVVFGLFFNDRLDALAEHDKAREGARAVAELIDGEGIA